MPEIDLPLSNSLCSICKTEGHLASSCPKRRFRGVMGHWVLSGLFLERPTWNDGRDLEDYTLYTIRDHDHKGYPSIVRLYLEMEDLTEWEFANTYFGGWEHWQRLCDGFLRDHVIRWRNELELKVQAKALKQVQIEAESGGKNALQANKYLLAKGWVRDRRGRPSKAEIQASAKTIAASDTRVTEDLKRLDIN